MKLMKPADLTGFRRGPRQENGIILSQRYKRPRACIPHKGLNLAQKKLRSTGLNGGFQEDIGNKQPME